MSGIDQRDFIKIHQVVSCTNQAKSSLSNTKIFTKKAIKTVVFSHFPDLFLCFGFMAINFSDQLIRKLKIGYEGRIKEVGKLIIPRNQRFTAAIGRELFAFSLILLGRTNIRDF